MIACLLPLYLAGYPYVYAPLVGLGEIRDRVRVAEAGTVGGAHSTLTSPYEKNL